MNTHGEEVNLKKLLARTYGRYDRDPWLYVEEYQRILEWSGEHPNRGSSAASKALNLPRSRIRPWFDDSVPDPVRAIQTAESHSWLDIEPGDIVFEALVICHAWIFAGGSIPKENYRLTFSVGENDPEPVLRDALDELGIGTKIARERTGSQARELVPATDASVFGRYLSVVGAPVGNKGPCNEITIPEWVPNAPFDTRLRWARTYVTLRGTSRPGRPQIGVQIAEQRSPEYLDALADLFRGIVGHPDTVTRSGTNLYFNPRAAAMIDQKPDLPSE